MLNILKSKLKKKYEKIAKIELKKVLNYLIESSENTYQPLQVGNMEHPGIRDVSQRWKAIRKVIMEYKADTVLDVGCAEGWYIRKVAQKLNCFCLGVEFDTSRLWRGELSRLIDGIKGYAVIKAKLDSDSVLRLPKFDIVLCLSVTHHIIRKEGIEEARRFIKNLGRKANKALIFDMGTTSENWIKIRGSLPEMSEGQEFFISDFLKSAGYINVRRIGSSDSILKDATRLLFVAEPSNENGSL